MIFYEAVARGYISKALVTKQRLYILNKPVYCKNKTNKGTYLIVTQLDLLFNASVWSRTAV